MPGNGGLRRGIARYAPGRRSVLGILVFYWVEASLRRTPWLFTDELEWTQLSRAIAGTGHAARRGEPHSFESLYSFLIAPAWWIHSTSAAYAAVKYINAVVMCLTAVPAYLLARMLVSRRWALAVALLSIAIPAMGYATSIVPESLAYLWFTAAALFAVRLARRAELGRGRSRASCSPPAGRSGAVGVRRAAGVLVLAAAIVWVARPRRDGFRWRRVAARRGGARPLRGRRSTSLVVQHVQSWSFGQYFNHHTSARAASRRARSRSGSGSCR